MEYQEDVLDFREWIGRLRRRRGWIAAAAALGLAAGIAAAAMQKPSYQMTTMMLVKPNGEFRPQGGTPESSAYGPQALEAVMKSDEAILKSPVIARRVVESLHLSEAPEDVMKRISASHTSNLLTVTVRDRDPYKAAAMANAAAEAFAQEVATWPEPQTVRILDRAAVSPGLRPERGAKPVVIVVAALLTGMAAGVGLVTIVEAADRRIRSRRGAERQLGVPVLAAYRRLKGVGASARAPELTPAEWEVVRSLRTNLRFASGDAPLRVLVVTACAPGEGVTTAAATLAVSEGRAGQRVLVVDANLRNPRLREWFGAPDGGPDGRLGLAGVLAGSAPWRDVVCRTPEPGVDLLPAGSVEESVPDLPAWDRLRGVLEEAGSEYDRVVVDAPALLMSADAQILSSLADGVLWVVRSGRLTPEAASEGRRVLRLAGARVLGVLWNDPATPPLRGPADGEPALLPAPGS
ncbi:MAG: Wzz/FepE/Etk N-terminal domain-containing protein [Alicyclobacillaceae bacterium]|nr:Wzz/FepE/Etk N-terminal domain-containing protein [Alicyclobacillaceae bacterium]